MQKVSTFRLLACILFSLDLEKKYIPYLKI